jgi:hypothetical protein
MADYHIAISTPKRSALTIFLSFLRRSRTALAVTAQRVHTILKNWHYQKQVGCQSRGVPWTAIILRFFRRNLRGFRDESTTFCINIVILDGETRATRCTTRIGYILVAINDHFVDHAGQVYFKYIPAGVVFMLLARPGSASVAKKMTQTRSE